MLVLIVFADLSAMDEDTLAELGGLVPMYEELAKTAKIHLLQSIVSRILVEMVFNTYFAGLSKDQTGLFRQMEDLLSKFCGKLPYLNSLQCTNTAWHRRTRRASKPMARIYTNAASS